MDLYTALPQWLSITTLPLRLMGLIITGHLKQTFTTIMAMPCGNAVWQKSDTTDDGFKDYRINFKYGLAETITFRNPVTKKASKVQRYGPIKLKSAEIANKSNK